MTGKTQTIESGTDVTITLNADEGRVRIGGHGTQGSLRLGDPIGLLVFDADGRWLSLGTSREFLGARPEGHPGGLRLFDEKGRLIGRFDAATAKLMVGRSELQNSREIELDGAMCVVRIGEPRATDEQGRPTLMGGDRAIELRGSNATVKVGCDDIPGVAEFQDGKNRTTIRLDASNAALRLGTRGCDGDLLMRDAMDRQVVHLDGSQAELSLGASGVASGLRMQDAHGRETLHYDAADAALRVGTTGNDGKLSVQDANGRETLRYDGAGAALRVGTTGNDGKLIVRDDANRAVLTAEGNSASLTLGAAGHAGTVAVCDANGKQTIQLDGASGDILLTNADCAEEFDFGVASVAPGTVVVIGEQERLMPSTEAYDRRVAGVVSGAGRFRPAIVLDRRAGAARPAVAMIGKVECRVDASQGPIRCGDLLVSSPTPGHAMAAKDPARTPGAVLGKALRGLDEGTGMIPILVCLQ